ncbi:ankyrin repeat-containing protein BDA1-like [Populus alba x Populus x berolinensis]|uniref:Ankyrin repeat-containing protein BDA1-like n=1 Tax=Populus alba x Populus x berolinensis TaxID=444605 RepID=A0AAD6Q475_9ROSI|nr:ankyrin repeat-containing protein BDA1-like [Populus alba x Populus x berolinensis]
MTPFHHAAIRGRAEVIGLMLSGCPDCIEDETERRENALHLAVRNNRFEAIKMLVDWNREMNKEYLLNKKHEQGNTALHLASWKKTRPGDRRSARQHKCKPRLPGSECRKP